MSSLLSLSPCSGGFSCVPPWPDHHSSLVSYAFLGPALSPSLELENYPSDRGHLYLDALEAHETQYALDHSYLLPSPKSILTLLFLIPVNSATHRHAHQIQPACLPHIHILLPFNQSSFLLPTFISKPSLSLHLHTYGPGQASHPLSAAY